MFSISRPPYAWREVISVQNSSRSDAEGSYNDFLSVSNEDCEKSILWRLHGQSLISVALCLFLWKQRSTDPEAHRLGHSSALFCKSVVCISGSGLVAHSQGNVVRIWLLYCVLLPHAWLHATAWVAVSVFSVLWIVTTFKDQLNTCVCLFVDDTRFKEE
jgi:hypothetical protein